MDYRKKYIIESDGSQRPQYMICYAKLRNCCLAPAKLKERFRKVHGDRKYWNTNATPPVFSFVLIDKPILTALYEVAYLIAKQGKLHTIGEKLVKPAALKKANIIFGKATKNKSSQIPLSNGTISNKIDKFKIHSFF